LIDVVAGTRRALDIARRFLDYRDTIGKSRPFAFATSIAFG